MTGHKRTLDLLRQAARDGRLSGQVEAYSDASEGIRRLLAEIEGCILPRRLVIEVGPAQLVAEAAARRLVALVTPAPEPVAPAALALFGRNLDAADAAEAAGLLADLCTRGDRLRITDRAAEIAGDPTRGGIPAAALAAALGFEPPVPAGPAADPVEALALALGPALREAALIAGEEVEVLAGEEAAVLDLAGQIADGLLHPGFPLFATLETGAALVLAGGDAGMHILVAGWLGRFLVARIEGEASATLALWRHLA